MPPGKRTSASRVKVKPVPVTVSVAVPPGTTAPKSEALPAGVGFTGSAKAGAVIRNPTNRIGRNSFCFTLICTFRLYSPSFTMDSKKCGTARNLNPQLALRPAASLVSESCGVAVRRIFFHCPVSVNCRDRKVHISVRPLE